MPGLTEKGPAVARLAGWICGGFKKTDTVQVADKAAQCLCPFDGGRSTAPFRQCRRGVQLAAETEISVPTSPCPPLSDAQWPPCIDDLRTGFAGALNVYRTMAHHPDLLRAWAPLRQHIVRDSALGAARSEVVILRAAHRMGSAYEWAHHVSRARSLGFSDARIAALGGDPEGEDGLIARGVDALFDHRRLPPALEAELAAALGRPAVIDLIATVGFYTVLGHLLMTYETPIDTGVAAEMAAHPL
jgi:4-carboxymuconolactone decarboxylase